MAMKNPLEYSMSENDTVLARLKFEYEIELATLKMKGHGVNGNHDRNRYI